VILLGIYPKECNTGYNRDTCTLMFIAVLFTIAKFWKQPGCPTTDEWIKKMWCICTQWSIAQPELIVMGFEGKWMQLEDIVLSKISQAQK
jgi:hypothetical protein